MKKMKIGFLSLVAVVALGFTVSEKIDFSGNTKKTIGIPACFREVSVRNSNCSGTSTDFIDNARLCPGETSGLLNRKLWGVTGLTYVYTGSKPPDCSVGTTDFCCASVVEDDSPCPGQPQFDLDGDKDLDYYKIVNTYCRP